MPEDFSLKKNINYSELNAQLNSESITFGTKDGQTFKLSLFDMIKNNKDLNTLSGIIDEDNNGEIDERELAQFKQKIIESAGDDKILQEEEILKILGAEFKTEKSEFLNAEMQVLIERAKEENNTTHNETYDRTTAVTTNADKSGAHVFTRPDVKVKDVNLYNEGHKLRERIILTNCNMLDTTEDFSVQVTNHLKYDENGNVTEHTLIYPGKNSENYFDSDNLNPYIRSSRFTYYPDGSKKSEVIEQEDKKNGNKTLIKREFDENGNVISESTEKLFTQNGKQVRTINSTTNEYDSNGNKIKVSEYSESETGIKTQTETNYNSEGVITGKKSRKERENTITVDEYTGVNIENRDNKLPTTRIIYAKDGTTVLSKTENEFDSEGILQKQTVFTPNDEGELAKTVYDVSGLNNIFEANIHQGGIGNCYFIESVLSLAQTKPGQKLLQKIVTPETVVDENGTPTTVYHLHFAGVEAAKKYLLEKFAPEKQKNNDPNAYVETVDEDKVYIKSDYDITAYELHNASIKAGKNYSFGDKDYLLLELGYEKFRQDSERTAMENRVSSLFNKYVSALDNGNGDNVMDGGFSFITMYILTGKKSDIYQNPAEKVPVCHIDDTGELHLTESETYNDDGLAQTPSDAIKKKYDNIDKYLKVLKKDTNKKGLFKNHAIFAGLKISQQVVNGKTISDGGHVFVMKGITDKEVILINPWDGTKDLRMSIEDFKKAVMQFGGIDCRE